MKREGPTFVPNVCKPLSTVRIVQLVWLLAHPVPFGYDSCARLFRAQEARVRAILWSSPAGTVQTYCLEHLAAAAGGRSCRSSQMMNVR
ncbi:MAG TPA: hypothetical protein VK878_20610, partial [Candidatus Deferrimicrobiaceae bacterium]|nr:hypothetical protein [Candidatus Deferrimicrobiaceae bacterium]